MNITLSITDELDKRLKKYPQINRSELFRQCADLKLKVFEAMEFSTEKIPIEVLQKLSGEIEITSVTESQNG